MDGAFYFDLASPEAYLVAEQILHVMPVPCEWIPIRGDALPAMRCAYEEDAWREDFARRAAALSLQPVVWPEPFPFDSDKAMLAATFARRTGRTVAFCQAAFRQAYAGGRALSDVDNVVIAAAACELHPNAVLKGIETRSVADELDRETVDAQARGVTQVPAVRIGERIFCDLHEAAAA